MVSIVDARHMGRLKDIVIVLLRYGFDDLVQKLNLPGRFILKRVIRTEEHLTTPARIRRVLEELGPTYIKFGQVMSLRSDLLPQDVVEELRHLQDAVPPADPEAIRKRLQQELDAPIDEVFAEFDPEPLAAASLAQVHRAVLASNGRQVAVKIQRPGIAKVIRSDIALLRLLVEQIEKRTDAFAIYDLPALLDEFERTIERELSYVRERTSMRIFRRNFAETGWLHIPSVDDKLCTDRLLVMELVEGDKIGELAADDYRRGLLAKRGLQVICQQILQDGFFHADPHPGNLLALEGGRLCLLDCGMVGRLTQASRDQLTSLLKATIDHDAETVSDLILALTDGRHRCDYDRLTLDVLDLLDNYHSNRLCDIHIGNFLWDLTDIIREHHLRLPQNLAMMIRALVTAEGVARQLDPDFDIFSEIAPVVEKLGRSQWHPQRVVDGLADQVDRIWSIGRSLPRRIDHVVDKVENDQLSITFKHDNLENLQETIDDTASRLTVAIILAAIVIGSSIIITTESGPVLFGVPVLGLIGFLISAILGMWVVWNILRSHRW